ncbi:ribbon-helix-helix domain-containing protein [Sinorhizobium meliloti SM11]|uniref:YlcI/YnfO family protein n=1 Tax=Rhizobium meliloti TaxID=382 RepID=UPI0011803405|nr:YlcI/YnfO family protein [Sinorhizobium meliloti]MDE4557563.1 ribbon-helix-helix domain-containing protein [Sinorhizobium meliloti SM11]
MTAYTTPSIRRRMGRPPLNMKSTNVRFPAETLERIDALVGDKHRAKFIREAVERELERVEKAPHDDEMP